MSKKIWFTFIASVLILCIIEVLSYFGLSILARYKDINFEQVTTTESLSEESLDRLRKVINNQNTYIAFDPTLGWTIKQSGYAEKYRANDEGIRAERNYESKKPQGVFRIAAFGDSFTHASEVRNHEMWTAVIEQQHPKFEVLNFGVPGYGLDQAYLRFKKEFERFSPDAVLIGFMNENIDRHVNVFRPFYYPGTALALSKPRFMLDGHRLTLIENPLKSLRDLGMLLDNPKRMFDALADNDYFESHRINRGWFDFLSTVKLVKILFAYAAYEESTLKGEYNVESEAFKITAAIFDSFYEYVKRMGARPIIVLFPNRDFMQNYLDRGVKQYAPLIEYFNAKNYDFIDLSEGFKKSIESEMVSMDDLFKGHYSVVGNGLVAELIGKKLLESRNP